MNADLIVWALMYGWIITVATFIEKPTIADLIGAMIAAFFWPFTLPIAILRKLLWGK